MEWKETRGRKRKYEFTFKKGQVVSIDPKLRHTLYAQAKKEGVKIRTWVDGDLWYEVI